MSLLVFDSEINDRVCPLCGKPGNIVHNGAPLIDDAQVCDDCNYNKVIPARLAEMQKRSKDA